MSPPPAFEPSRRVVNSTKDIGVKLTLFQFQTCPFCCKVRAALDYFGLNYDIIEVNSVMRQQVQRKVVDWGAVFFNILLLIMRLGVPFLPLVGSGRKWRKKVESSRQSVFLRKWVGRLFRESFGYNLQLVIKKNFTLNFASASNEWF
jgi:glutaredoxin